MLFVSAKVSHLGHLPQGQPERDKRVLAMVRQMDGEGFGNCTNHYECVAVCPAGIPGSVMAKMYREYAIASLAERAGNNA
jgi:succinate dehydrogenase / fumarate reductase iron-sulfur subunit